MLPGRLADGRILDSSRAAAPSTFSNIKIMFSILCSAHAGIFLAYRFLSAQFIVLYFQDQEMGPRFGGIF